MTGAKRLLSSIRPKIATRGVFAADICPAPFTALPKIVRSCDAPPMQGRSSLMRLRHGYGGGGVTCVYGMGSLDFCIRLRRGKVKYCGGKSGPLPEQARMR